MIRALREQVAQLRSTWPQWVLIIVALVAAVLIRRYLRPYASDDYNVYMGPWFNHLREHGVSGLVDVDANYSPPFLYILLAGTILPLDGNYVIKLVSGVFDFASAAGVVAIVHQWRPNLIRSVACGVAFLFAPEVLLNSSLWGQVDSIHTAFIIWAIYALIRGKDIPAWILYGLALAFKLQAIFLLPFMLIAFLWQRHRWYAPLIGLGTALLTFVPAIIVGRPIDRVFVFLELPGYSMNELQLNAPNLYQWIPNHLFDLMNPGGVMLGIAVTAVLGIVYLQRPSSFLQTAAVFALAIPFVLPQMHDRYFYVGNVLILVCAAISRRYWLPAIALQFVAVMAYAKFLGLNQTVPLGLVAILMLATIGYVIWLSLDRLTTDYPVGTEIVRNA